MLMVKRMKIFVETNSITALADLKPADSKLVKVLGYKRETDEKLSFGESMSEDVFAIAYNETQVVFTRLYLRKVTTEEQEVYVATVKQDPDSYQTEIAKSRQKRLSEISELEDFILVKTVEFRK